jgi:hypothetical protein
MYRFAVAALTVVMLIVATLTVRLPDSAYEIRCQ